MNSFGFVGVGSAGAALVGARGGDELADWTEFSFLESTANLKPLVKRFSGRTPSTSLAREIAACLQQGRLFYQSADRSSIEIRPLLLFYGTMAFARGLIASQHHTSLAAMPHSHGLRDTSQTSRQIADLSVRIGSAGTFQQFNDVVSALNSFRYSTDTQPATLPMPTASSDQVAGLELPLTSILARVPGLEELFSPTFGTTALTEAILVSSDRDESWRLRIDDPLVYGGRSDLVQIVAKLRDRFPTLKKWRMVEATRAWARSVIYFTNVSPPEGELEESTLGEFQSRFVVQQTLAEETRLKLLDILSPLGGTFSARAALIAPIDNRYLSEFSLHYLGMYLLSSVVRYRPHLWVHAITRSVTAENPADDHAIALLERFMDLHATAIRELVTSTLGLKAS